jgi:hypothetical protein
MLQKNYEKALANHKLHLAVVTELNDKAGQSTFGGVAIPRPGRP